MFIRSAALSTLAVALLVVTSTSAAPRERPRSGRTAQPSAAASSDAEARATLRQAVDRHLYRAGIRGELRPLKVSPALVQLRRYVEAHQAEARLVCVVDLALQDDHGRILATVRGNASAVGTAAPDVIDAAARSAVERLPSALQALRQSHETLEIARR